MIRHPAAIVLDALEQGQYVILDDTAYAMEETGRQLCYMRPTRPFVLPGAHPV